MINEKLCRFYSPDWLSSLLVDALPDLSPNAIVDLGSGPGSLSNAASLRWPGARVITVDADPAIAERRSRNDLDHTHLCRNVLSDGLARAIGIKPAAIELVISNPPYTRTARNRSIDRVLGRAGLAEAVAGWAMVPADLVFLAQALLLAQPGGLIAFVVPDILISSSLMKDTRRSIISRHQILTVIQLPRGTFGRTDALAFVIVIRKGVTGEPINLRSVDQYGVTNTSIVINDEKGVLRLDSIFHSANTLGNERETLKDLGVTVARGRSNSRDVAQSNGEIFHTSNFPMLPGGKILLEGSAARCNGIIAEAGDILLARVDRRLENKVAVVEAGCSEISDCVLRLRMPRDVRGRVLAGLTSGDGQRQIVATSRGTGARHISHKAVLSIRV